MVLAVAVLAQGIAPFAFKIDRRGVEEHQIEFGKEVATMCKKPFFDKILGAAWRKRRGPGLLVLGQRFTQPSHRPIQMVQLKLVDPLDLESFFPFLGRPIAAGSEQAM